MTSPSSEQRGYIDWPIAICWGLIGLIVLAIPFMIMAAIQNQREWETFATAHNCKIIGKMDGDTSVGVAPVIGGNNNGGIAVVTTTTSGKTGYQCDDGITYWRNN